jgi:hypothetical protein
MLHINHKTLVFSLAVFFSNNLKGHRSDLVDDRGTFPCFSLQIF